VFDRLLDRSEWQGDCLVYQGSGPRGYGTIYSLDADRKVYVHCLVYERTIGPVPSGWDVDHVATRGCVSKKCINPEHLEAVTHRENQRRIRLAVCRSGKHDLTDPANVRWDKDGNRRGCRLCHLDHNTERRKGLR
jgi:hypothetical protein